MPTIVPKYKCKYCNQSKYSKEAFDRHFIFCKYVNTPVKERELQEILPSPTVMFQYLLDLTIKYQDLEKKMNKIKTNQSNQTRKSILEHLKHVSLNITFSKWIESINIDKYHLKIFYDQNFVESANKIISDELKDHDKDVKPIRNYIQKSNHIYIYDDVDDCSNIFEWRLMNTHDWTRWIHMISKKIKNMYFEWKKENQCEIDNDTMSELNYEYMRKINNIGEQMEMKRRQIKDTVIKHIQTSFVSIE
jgi:glycerol-3-phosphate cytidylyltransferase-like family protein